MELNAIACVLCRAKKCKCDRKLPICSQCEASGTACQYPPSNKRGIPSGYISCLEQRLLETETALLEALILINATLDGRDSRQVDTHYYDVLTEYSTEQSKEEKLEEWKRLPLRFGDQQQSWLQEKLRSVKSFEDRKNSTLGLFPASHETDPQWMGSLLHPVEHSATQLLPQRRCLNQRPSKQYAQERIPSEFQSTAKREGSQENGHDSSQGPLETPTGLLNNDLWTNHPETRQTSEQTGASIVDGAEAIDLDHLVQNSQFLYGQHVPNLQTASEQNPMSEGVSSSPFQDQRSSISAIPGGSSGQQRQSRQLSSKQWAKYF